MQVFPNLGTFLLIASLAILPALAEPVRIIFDTDMGNDVDDAIALALLHAMETRGEARILAVTITKDNRYAAPFVALFNKAYGRPGIPIGVVKDGVTKDDGKYLRPVLQSFNAPAERRVSRRSRTFTKNTRRAARRQRGYRAGRIQHEPRAAARHRP